MRKQLDPKTKKQLAARVNYYREMGIHDFYRQQVPPGEQVADTTEVMAGPGSPLFDLSLPVIQDKPAALKIIREDIGDCTRCRLHKGRTNLVFGVGNVNADIMFVGEGPGADEDAQGEPFVGRAGQLLNNMISAMGIKREDVYIANVVKCRPPGNRTPENDECDTCSPFLLRQIEVIRPNGMELQTKSFGEFQIFLSGSNTEETLRSTSFVLMSFSSQEVDSALLPVRVHNLHPMDESVGSRLRDRRYHSKLPIVSAVHLLGPDP